MAEMGWYRGELVTRINGWASRHRRPTAGAIEHEESLGDVIDRIAVVADRAFHLLMTDDPSGELMHAAWTRLAEEEVAYGDLVRAVADGRRSLPDVPVCLWKGYFGS
ncbi:hypothetical protein ACFVMC_28685 [Nocardia sp. NPDC127579]|uniref:hypothetical protein n=1 Tax=Nocardia sp. NPDC127579 TaxID=3345402 RepID=UPI00362F404A